MTDQEIAVGDSNDNVPDIIPIMPIIAIRIVKPRDSMLLLQPNSSISDGKNTDMVKPEPPRTNRVSQAPLTITQP